MLSQILHWIVIVLLCLSGLILSLLGGFLIYLGGSPYYVLAGLVTLAVSVQLFRRNPKALLVYGILLAVTVVWSVYESGFDLLALLPRLGFWLGLGIWFLTGWYRQTLKRAKVVQEPMHRRWVVAPMLFAVMVMGFAASKDYTRNAKGTVKATPDTTPITDWQHYGNTAGGTRFAELDQINPSTVKGLKEVWRYRTGVEKDFKMTPLQVDDKLYICGAQNVLMAVNSDTGEEIWRYDPKAVVPAKHQYARTCRGISYHKAGEDYTGQCPRRIVTATVDARLMTVNADTGELCTDFGNDGVVDLREGMGEHLAKQYYVTSPALVADDVFVVGGLVLDSQDLGLPSGVVRAYDATTGDFAWAWDLG